MHDQRRTLGRLLGWGGALVFSLLVWFALFQFVSRSLANDPCQDANLGSRDQAQCVASQTR